LTIEWDGKRDATTSKEGLFDGEEHHGGSTFMGGSGGADTV
jgi:hypothetical protein